MTDVDEVEERREGKPNMGFVGVMTGLAERDSAGRRSGSAFIGERKAGVAERAVEETGVTEREGGIVCESVFKSRMAGGCWSRRTLHEIVKAYTQYDHYRT